MYSINNSGLFVLVAFTKDYTKLYANIINNDVSFLLKLKRISSLIVIMY